MSIEPVKPKQGARKASAARGIWWDFSSGSVNHHKLHKPSCQGCGGGDRSHCVRSEMSRSSTSPALATARQPSSASSGSSTTGAKTTEQVVVGVCAMNSKVCRGCVF